jgi:hypothetical protein
MFNNIIKVVAAPRYGSSFIKMMKSTTLTQIIILDTAEICS